MGWFIVLIVVGAIAIALGLTLKNKFHHNDDDEPAPGPPGPVTQKYGDALKIALQFFDIQKCKHKYLFLNVEYIIIIIIIALLALLVCKVVGGWL